MMAHLFDETTLRDGRPSYGTQVTGELLGVQFDGRNFEVVMLPDDAQAPRTCSIATPTARRALGATRGVLGRARVGRATSHALARRAANRDRAFGDVDPELAHARVGDAGDDGAAEAEADAGAGRPTSGAAARRGADGEGGGKEREERGRAATPTRRCASGTSGTARCRAAAPRPPRRGRRRACASRRTARRASSSRRAAA